MLILINRVHRSLRQILHRIKMHLYIRLIPPVQINLVLKTDRLQNHLHHIRINILITPLLDCLELF